MRSIVVFSSVMILGCGGLAACAGQPQTTSTTATAVPVSALPATGQAVPPSTVVAPAPNAQAVATTAPAKPEQKTCQTDGVTGTLVRSRTVCMSDDEEDSENSATRSQLDMYRRGGNGKIGN